MKTESDKHRSVYNNNSNNSVLVIYEGFITRKKEQESEWN